MLPNKLYSFFCILCTSVLLHIDEGNSENENQVLGESDSSELYEALTIIYYPDEHLYSLADTQTIQKISSRPAFGPNYSHVLLLCPEQYEKPYLKIIVIYERNIEIHDTRICKHPYKPGRSIHVYIGYYITSNDTKLIRKNLPLISKLRVWGDAFPLMQVIQVNEIHSTWLRPTQTTHTFISYKHFLSSDSLISCPYPSIPDKDGPNVSKALEHLYDIDLTPFYQKEHQDKVLQKFVHQEGEYFVRQQLVPIDDFVDEPSRRATCYNLNTVPIWKSIVEGPIKMMEKFIRYIAQMLDINTLSVTTRAHDLLKLPLVEDPKEKDILYMDYKEQRMPVSKIFIKILHYHVRVERHKKNKDKNHHPTLFRYHYNDGYETEISTPGEKEDSHEDTHINSSIGHVSSLEQEMDETLLPDQHKKDEQVSALTMEQTSDALLSDQQGKDHEKDNILGAEHHVIDHEEKDTLLSVQHNKDDGTDKVSSDQSDTGDVKDNNPSSNLQNEDNKKQQVSTSHSYTKDSKSYELPSPNQNGNETPISNPHSDDEKGTSFANQQDKVHKIDTTTNTDQHDEDDGKAQVLPSDLHHAYHHEKYADSYNEDDYGEDVLFERNIRVGFSSSSEEEEDSEKDKHYYILIAVHNELEAPLINKLCENDICDINGFIMTKNYNERKTYYCCAIDNLLLPKYRSHLLTPEHNFETFNLNNVPTKIDEDGNIVTTIQIPTYLN